MSETWAWYVRLEKPVESVLARCKLSCIMFSARLFVCHDWSQKMMSQDCFGSIFRFEQLMIWLGVCGADVVNKSRTWKMR